MENLAFISRNPRRILEKIRYRSLKVFGHTDFIRFIILSRSRTGSNLLVSYLNSHPNIYCQGEIFSKLSGKNYIKLLTNAFSRQPYYIKATGFKIFYYHPTDSEHCSLWEKLENMPDLKVIHLKRRNILRTLISRKIAGVKDIWINNDGNQYIPEETKTIDFTYQELFNGFQETRQWETEGDQRFSGHHLLTLYYEDLARNKNLEIKKVTDFLELPFYPPMTSMVKQNPEKISELLIRYTELKEAFRETEWSSFFEEEL